MYTVVMLTKEEARAALLTAFAEKYPELADVLAAPETIVEVRQFDSEKDIFVTAEVRWEHKEHNVQQK